MATTQLHCEMITQAKPGTAHWLPGRGWRGALLDSLTTTRATFNGNNASAWKKDVLRVIGFDERMGYGGLDRELGARLINAGVRPKQIRHRAICVHLDHPRNYIDAAVVAHNRVIWSETRRHRHTWTRSGIQQEVECLRLETSNSSVPKTFIDLGSRFGHAA